MSQKETIFFFGRCCCCEKRTKKTPISHFDSSCSKFRLHFDRENSTYSSFLFFSFLVNWFLCSAKNFVLLFRFSKGFSLCVIHYYRTRQLNQFGAFSGENWGIFHTHQLFSFELWFILVSWLSVFNFRISVYNFHPLIDNYNLNWYANGILNWEFGKVNKTERQW